MFSSVLICGVSKQHMITRGLARAGNRGMPPTLLEITLDFNFVQVQYINSTISADQYRPDQYRPDRPLVVVRSARLPS
jgi:hypothetical protein